MGSLIITIFQREPEQISSLLLHITEHQSRIGVARHDKASRFRLKLNVENCSINK